jgi:chromate transporter
VIANLALWFGLRVLFGEMAGRWPVPSSLQWDAVLLALVAACLFGLRLGVAATLGIAALAGLALRTIA